MSSWAESRLITIWRLECLPVCVSLHSNISCCCFCCRYGSVYDLVKYHGSSRSSSEALAPQVYPDRESQPHSTRISVIIARGECGPCWDGWTIEVADQPVSRLIPEILLFQPRLWRRLAPLCSRPRHTIKSRQTKVAINQTPYSNPKPTISFS